MEMIKAKLGFSNKVARVLWKITWAILFRPSPRLFHFWRVFLLRIFQADIGRGVHVYPSAKIWAPWNLSMGDYSCLGDDVNCYSVGRVVIGKKSVVSQNVFLCTASHDFDDVEFPLITGEISVGDFAWLAADTFVGPNVRIGEGAVIYARSVVVRNVNPWKIAVGVPAREISTRKVKLKNDLL